jgi:hypothetical protein
VNGIISGVRGYFVEKYIYKKKPKSFYTDFTIIIIIIIRGNEVARSGRENGNRNRSMKVVFAQTPIIESQLEALKRMSGTKTTKDALQAAINHFLSCPLVRDAVRMRGEEKKGGAEEEEEEEERKVVKRKENGKEPEDWWWFPEK